VGEGRQTYVNFGALRRPYLFVAARALNGSDEPRGPALVVAQSVVELAFETAIDWALELREVHDPLREWVEASVFSWSPRNDRVKGLWMALTGDKISDAPGWARLRGGCEIAGCLRPSGGGCVGGAG
jgi:hypothetical protein